MEQVARPASGVDHKINYQEFVQSNLRALSVYARNLADGPDCLLTV